MANQLACDSRLLLLGIYTTEKKEQTEAGMVTQCIKPELLVHFASDVSKKVVEDGPNAGPLSLMWDTWMEFLAQPQLL